ncbi:MAG: heme o synthase [Flavobacteriales bacterium]|nr:heme o synthase [Flavobacteriales bacterium]
MASKSTDTIATSSLAASKLKSVVQLLKVRLTISVVLSSVFGFLMFNGAINWSALFVLIISGFATTFASNIFNQILEKDTDALMNRTKNRPLPEGRLSVFEALVIAVFCISIGLFLLFYFLNPLSGWLGALAFVLYSFVYTPLKTKTSWSVIIGAFPGAIPPMLGYVAASNTFGLLPGLLFAFQFFWQFPHFWAIAWKLDDQYQNAGLKMLPFNNTKPKASLRIILFSSIVFALSAIVPFLLGYVGNVALIVSIIVGTWLVFKAFKLLQKKGKKESLHLMLATLVYLLAVQIIFIFDKI